MKQPLGREQKGLFSSLQRHHAWYDGCGWHWGGYAKTTRILDSLVRRGLVEVKEETFTNGYTKPVYRPCNIS